MVLTPPRSTRTDPPFPRASLFLSDYAIAPESPMTRDIAAARAGGHFPEPPPLGDVVGPTAPRADPSGLILRGGRIVAEWGPTNRADMTFSVTKPYLSIMSGHAVGGGLIPDVPRPAAALVDDGGFAPPQNRTVTREPPLTNTTTSAG